MTQHSLPLNGAHGIWVSDLLLAVSGARSRLDRLLVSSTKTIDPDQKGQNAEFLSLTWTHKGGLLGNLRSFAIFAAIRRG
jgi:hypothetical protein